MGSSHLLPLSPPLHYHTLNPTKTSQTLKFLPKFPVSSNPRPDPDAIRARGFDFDDGFGFGGRKKRRSWWSDDDDEDEDEDDDEFWEEPSSFDWLFKALRAFGWMIPAVLISALLGTGTNSMIMALVLPLGQTALSLVMDKLWGSPSSSPEPRPRSKSRPRPRPRRNPTVGTANGTQVNEETREPTTGKRQSWQTANSRSAKKGGKTGSRFGGWDELDEQTRSSSFSREEQKRNTDDLPRENSGTGKLSRRRNREKPLLMRLLIAVFPFVGSWTRFFF